MALDHVRSSTPRNLLQRWHKGHAQANTVPSTDKYQAPWTWQGQILIILISYSNSLAAERPHARLDDRCGGQESCTRATNVTMQ